MRKNQGRKTTASRCSTSRKKTFATEKIHDNPSTRQIRAATIGMTSATVRAFAGSTISAIGIRMMSITPIVTVCASTADAGTSSRGNQTFFISSPFETSDVVPSWMPGLEEPPHRQAREHEQRVVRDVPGRPPEHREHECVDAIIASG